MNHTMTCIICPRGCTLTVSDESGIITVEGQGCNRGEQYGIAEYTNPTRTVTSTVRIANRTDRMVSVKTAAPIPKAEMAAVMKQIRETAINAPVSIGDVVIDAVCGTCIIATANVE